jgi:YVTN family beta-propeller protein
MTHYFSKTAGALTIASMLTTFALPAQSAEVAYVTNQGEGITLIDPVKLTIGKTVPLPDSDPRGLAVTPDGKFLLTTNLRSGDVAVIDTGTLVVVRRVPIGANPEFIRIMADGSKAFVTYEPSSSGGPPGKEADDDKGPKKPGQVAVIDLRTWTVVRSIVGAPETEGIEFTPDGKNVVVSNEGNDTLTVYDIASGSLLKTIDLKAFGHRPRGLKLYPNGRQYVVTMEDTDNFVVLDQDFKYVKSVPTAKGPYGIAFDKAGKRIFVAAARGGKLQVFDAATFATVADIPVGKRCWHFSFTPDESKLLLACGRSNDVEVIDANTYKVTSTLPGFKLPWGIVTYPKSYGSLDAP